MLDGSDELFGVAFGVLADSHLTCSSRSAIRASNCAHTAKKKALTAGAISASISGGIAIFDGGIGAAMHPLVPKLALRVQIDFSNP